MIVTALEPTTAIPNHVTHRNISSRPQNIMENSRIVFLDYLRVIACLMVIIVHCVEPFLFRRRRHADPKLERRILVYRH